MTCLVVKERNFRVRFRVVWMDRHWLCEEIAWRVHVPLRAYSHQAKKGAKKAKKMKEAA